MKRAIPDELAIRFSTAFYTAYVNSKPIPFAFEFAVNSVKMDRISGYDIPILLS